MDTTIRVKGETYRTIVKTRGAFEQTFGTKLTLDEAIFLAASYINIAYEIFQTLLRENLVEFVIAEKAGYFNVKSSAFDRIAEKALPRIVTAFDNFQMMLKAKGEKSLPQVIVGT